jgi:hypothetical protein
VQEIGEGGTDGGDQGGVFPASQVVGIDVSVGWPRHGAEGFGEQGPRPPERNLGVGSASVAAL